MKNYSYPSLMTVTVLFLLSVFTFIVWRGAIYKITFLNISTIHYMFCASLLLALFFIGALLRKPTNHQKSFLIWLKVYAWAVALLLILLGPILITVTYVLPGVVTSYSTAYRYESGGRNTCEGAVLFDKDLNENIRVCNPARSTGDDQSIFIKKRTNVLGAVVLLAVTEPGR